MPTLEFTVAGRPQPKQRPRMGRAGRFYTPRATHDYENEVALWAKAAAVKQGWVTPTVPVNVGLKFYLSNGKIDLDNVIKILLDGMTGVVIKDDNWLCVSGVFANAYRCDKGDEKVEVIIETREEDDEA